MTLRDLATLGIAILMCWLPGILGSVFTASGIDSWYQDLEKPWFNPPDWVFGPVWSVLYVLMGIALYLIWINRDGSRRWKGLVAVFASQLVFNGLWSFAFFGLESPSMGIAVILPLGLLIAATIALTTQFSRTAALLMVPYLAWVGFATVLNISIWQLN